LNNHYGNNNYIIKSDREGSIKVNYCLLNEFKKNFVQTKNINFNKNAKNLRFSNLLIFKIKKNIFLIQFFKIK
jgi:hypothetical protein